MVFYPLIKLISLIDFHTVFGVFYNVIQIFTCMICFQQTDCLDSLRTISSRRWPTRIYSEASSNFVSHLLLELRRWARGMAASGSKKSLQRWGAAFAPTLHKANLSRYDGCLS